MTRTEALIKLLKIGAAVQPDEDYLLLLPHECRDILALIDPRCPECGGEAPAAGERCADCDRPTRNDLVGV